MAADTLSLRERIAQQCREYVGDADVAEGLVGLVWPVVEQAIREEREKVKRETAQTPQQQGAAPDSSRQDTRAGGGDGETAWDKTRHAICKQMIEAIDAFLDRGEALEEGRNYVPGRPPHRARTCAIVYDAILPVVEQAIQQAREHWQQVIQVHQQTNKLLVEQVEQAESALAEKDAQIAALHQQLKEKCPEHLSGVHDDYYMPGHKEGGSTHEGDPHD